MNGAKRAVIKDQGTIRVQSQSPYEELDENVKEWLDHLKQIWPLWKKTSVVKDHLWGFFGNSQDPYKSALQLMLSSGDFYAGKQNSLAYYIMENFASWTKEQNPIPIFMGLKLDALSLVVRQKNAALITLVVETYKMKEDKEIFIEPIRHFCRCKNYKEACQVAGLLGLHEHFSLEDFLVQLVFQDKYMIAEKFLQKSERHRVELAKYLDNLIGQKSMPNEIHSIVMRLNIQDPKLISLNYKPLSKLIGRIMKTFNLPPDVCPNLNRKRGKGALQFLLHKRYVEKSIGGESWAEMVAEAVGNDTNLQEELVEGLILYRELKEALYWAERFKSPESTWPRQLLEFRQRENQEKGFLKEQWKDNWDLEKPHPSLKFHRLPIPESQIKLVDTASNFSNFINDLKGISVIGMDAEWKPSFGLKKCDLAILQIAAYHVVYIIDVITLSSAAPRNLWEQFANVFFGKPKLLKLGFGTSSDMSILKETLWKLHEIKTIELGFLDLAVLWKTLVQDFSFVFPFSLSSPYAKSSESLSTLIELCLGESLDKSDQFSNWENRPLRKSQIIYAALDAYCLLEAYNIIIAESEKQNIPVSEIIEEIISKTTSKVAKKKKKGGKSHQGAEFST